MKSNDEDQIIRDLMISSASNTQVKGEPTIISLYDTITVLERKNPDWLKDEFCCKIFAWQASMFLASHVKEVCQDKYPELLALCVEYRVLKTISGEPLPEWFAFEALKYYAKPVEEFYDGPFGCAPVRNCYFIIEIKD